MEIPTPEWIRERSNVNFVEYGYGEPEGADPDRLTYLIEDAVTELTGLMRVKGYALVPADVVDTTLESMLNRVIRMLVEFNAGAGQQEIMDTASDFDMISSVSAGPVSEQRREIKANVNILHPWPQLNRLLGELLSLAGAGIGSELTVPKVGLVDPMVPKPGAAIMDRGLPGLSPLDWPMVSRYPGWPP